MIKIGAAPAIRYLILCFIILSLPSSPAPAAEPMPGDACPTASQYIMTGGPETNGIAYFMTCYGGTWTSLLRTTTTGAISVAGLTALPAVDVDVPGEIRLGTTGLTCSATIGGSQRYNTTTKTMEFCDGTAWQAVPQVCPSATPTALNGAAPVVNAATSTLVTTTPFPPAGLTCNVPVTISGDGSPQFRTCNNSGCGAGSIQVNWTTGPALLVPGYYMQIQLTTSSSAGATSYARLNVGGYTYVWSVSTAVTTCGIGSPIGSVCPDGSVYAGSDVDGYVPMYVQRCDAGMSWNGSTCTGSRTLYNFSSPGTILHSLNRETGSANTANLIASAGDADAPYPSANYCRSLNEDGHTDWYLPALNEAIALASNQSVIGGFNTGNSYGTSTEGSIAGAQIIIFSSLAQSNAGKQFTYAVRCVRH